MKKMMTTMVLIICLVVSSPSIGQTKKVAPKAKGGSCISCHSDPSSILPKEHKPVKVVDITSCTGCHKPDFSDKTAPKPFSSHLHKPHMQSGSVIDCVTCHTWAPGKQFGIKGVKGNLGKVTKKDMSLIKGAFASWATSTSLDALHGKVGVVCLACHGKNIPEQGDTVENDRCLTCHGSMGALAKKTEPKDFADRNPHQSHLGDIACTVCHHAHRPSEIYCLGCHGKFIMKIPAGE